MTGSERPICGAKARSTGGVCQRPPGAGTDHLGYGRCSLHGGSTRNGRIHGARLRAEAEAARLGAEAPLSPAEALTWAVELVGGEARFLQHKVAELESGQIDGNRLHPLAVALGQTAERLARVAKLGVDAGLDERRLELDALVLDRIDGAIRAAIADAGLGAEDTERLNAALGSRFRELADSTPPRLNP